MKSYKHNDMLRQQIPMPPPHTEETLQKARLTVCANATDVEEAKELLDMLGLS